MDRPHSKMAEWGWEGKGGTTQREEQRKAKPLAVELDLSGKFHRGTMLWSSLENGKEAHWVLMGNFKQQEGFKMHIQLPDYDNSQ